MWGGASESEVSALFKVSFLVFTVTRFLGAVYLIVLGARMVLGAKRDPTVYSVYIKDKPKGSMPVRNFGRLFSEGW